MSTLRFFISHPIKSKKVKLAVGPRCELCGRETAIDDLQIHTFIGEEEGKACPPTDLEPFLLVLCFRCHSDVDTFGATVWEQELLVSRRPEEIRRNIRDVLAYAPRPYTPPDTDMEEAYKDACSSRFRFGV